MQPRQRSKCSATVRFSSTVPSTAACISQMRPRGESISSLKTTYDGQLGRQKPQCTQSRMSAGSMARYAELVTATVRGRLQVARDELRERERLAGGRRMERRRPQRRRPSPWRTQISTSSKAVLAGFDVQDQLDGLVAELERPRADERRLRVGSRPALHALDEGTASGAGHGREREARA